MNLIQFQLVILLAVIFSSSIKNPDDKFLLGNESLLKNHSSLLMDKKLGLITNKSGVLSDGTLLLDALKQNYYITKIFTPEHGLRVDDKDENYIDEQTGVPIVSLYGTKKKPDNTDLENVDVLIYDIQDVCARFYTFINTMFYCMEAAVENSKDIIICDRPIIPNGNYVDGFLLDNEITSFVGMIDVPVAYGMTCGELANFINAEYFEGKCKITVIKMENYSHETDYESLNLPWIKPSPNMYFPSSAIAYTGTCLFEGTNFSEGRGTERPFEYAGAPYCDGKKLSEEMKAYQLNGVLFEPVQFIPTSITSPSNPPKYVNENCEGVYIKVTDKKLFEPVKSGIAILVSLKKLFPEFEIKSNNFLDKLSGTKNLRLMVNEGKSYNEIIDSYRTQLDEFRLVRSKYLLYR